MILTAVNSKDIYVATNGTIANDGVLPETPTTFNNALKIYESGDTIKMKGGTYKASNYTINRSITITSQENEIVYIDKNIASSMFKLTSDNIEMSIKSINFINTRNRSGMIIYSFNTTPTNNNIITIENSSFENIKDTAVFQNYGSLKVNNSTFKNFHSIYGYGLVLNVQNTLLNITNSLFDSNIIAIGGAGGVIRALDSIFYSNNNTFSNNHALFGGAIHTSGNELDSSLTIINNTRFINNSAQYGGALVSTYNGRTIINNSFFEKNNATDGGAIYNDQMLEIINSTIKNNYADRIAGGLYSPFFEAILDNSDISSNNITNTSYTDLFAEYKDIYMPPIKVNITEVLDPNDSPHNLTMDVTHNHTDEDGYTIYSYCIEPLNFYA